MELNLTKHSILIFGVALLAAPVIAQQERAVKAPQERPALKTLKDRQSYSMGVELLRNLKRQGFDFDLNVLIMGMQDAFAGGQLAMTDEDMLESLNIAASLARQQKVGDQLDAGRANRKAEEAFAAENQTKEGVVTLPSGLQYKVIKDGNGPHPTAPDTVEVNYRATLLDGTQVESTYDNGRPASISVSDPHVIAGLREALKLMPVGATWRLFIPSRLAYGQRPVGNLIGPYSMLIYELELLALK